MSSFRVFTVSMIVFSVILAYGSAYAGTERKKSPQKSVEKPIIDADMPKLDSLSDKLMQAKGSALSKNMDLYLIELSSGNEKVSAIEKYKNSNNELRNSIVDKLGDANFLKTYDKNLVKYSPLLKNNMDVLTKINGEDVIFLVGAHFKGEKTEIPFNIINFNGKPTIVVHSVTDMVTYNTAKNTSRNIAANIVSTKLISMVKKVYRVFKDTDINNYAFFYTYGTRNFVTETSDNFESIGLISDKKLIEKAINAEITDQELLDKSSVLIKVGTKDDISRIQVKL